MFYENVMFEIQVLRHLYNTLMYFCTIFIVTFDQKCTDFQIFMSLSVKNKNIYLHPTANANMTFFSIFPT